MIGKVLNPASRKSGTAGIDFNYGFCDVYPNLALCQPTAGTAEDYRNDTMPGVKKVRDLMRNGMYHLASPRRTSSFIIRPNSGEMIFKLN